VDCDGSMTRCDEHRKLPENRLTLNHCVPSAVVCIERVSEHVPQCGERGEAKWCLARMLLGRRRKPMCGGSDAPGNID
jgi:hypothetical protein